jgi:TrmH family RNA methyltransferase
VLKLPVTSASIFVLVRPHYPENVGAVARAMKVMGMTRLVLVKPSRLALPDHELARKMAVKSGDVLAGARCVDSLSEALEGCLWAFATTSRRGVSGIWAPRRAAREAAAAAQQGSSVAFVFGNEKTGLSREDLALCARAVRIPMAAEQPSINLAQAAQILAYELFLVGLEQRNAEKIAAAGQAPGASNDPGSEAGAVAEDSEMLSREKRGEDGALASSAASDLPESDLPERHLPGE